MFTDTHCHINDEQFDSDRDAVIARARDAEVSTLVEIAESPEMWEPAVRLAKKYPFVYASLGIHPHYAHTYSSDQWTDLSARLKTLAQNPKVVAIGECGLDYFRMQNTKEQQDWLFRVQLELARELGKPVVIHCRDAQGDTQKILAEFFPEASTAIACPQPRGVIHCFSGAWADAQIYMAHGFMLGVDGPVTYPSAKVLQEVVRRMPLERLVLETDAPYLPPQTHRGQRNDSSHIPAIAAAAAVLKYKTLEDVGRQTTQNAKALFRLS